MTTPILHAHLVGAEAWRARADRAVMRALDEVVAAIARDAAERARASHPYTDRTGNLTASIGPRENFTRGDVVEGGVEAQMPYASYIEEGTENEDGSTRIAALPYLGPALTLAAESADAQLMDALDRAFAAV